MSRSKGRKKNGKGGKPASAAPAARVKRQQAPKRESVPTTVAKKPPGDSSWATSFLHSPESSYARWGFLVLLLVATWLVYMEGLSGGWLLDDYGNIVNNGGLVMHGFSWAGLWHAMWSFDAGPLGRPISLMTFALQRYFGGLHPGAFKTVNLVMHLICVVLLYGFTRELLHAWRRRCTSGLSTLRIEWTALAIAAAWALHPMNLEPVLYAVQRETILAAVFTLAGLWLYVYLRERFRVTTWRVLALLAATVIVFTALGAFSKETGALLPLFCLLLEAFVFRFKDGEERRVRISPWLYAVPLVFLAAIGLYRAFTGGYPGDYILLGMALFTLLLGFFVFYYSRSGEDWPGRKLWWLFMVLLFLPAVIGLTQHLPNVLHGGFVTREFNLGERLLTEGRVVIFYLGLVIVPRLSAMALHHDDIAISTGILSPPATLGAFLIIAALLVLAWLLRRRMPLVALGIVWFFAAQALTATIFPLELAYEHRIYLADWGIILAVAGLILLPVRAPRLRTLVTVAAALAIVALGVATAARAWTWRSNLSLAHAEARNHPMSPRGTYLLARIETNKALDGERRFMEPAFKAAQKATQVPNAGLDPWVAMVLLAAQTGRPVPKAWFEGMEHAVGERPFTVSDVNALEALINCYNRRQCDIQRGDIKRLFHAIDKSPRIQKLGMNYANVLVTEANFIGYDTAAERARSAPKLLKAANIKRNTSQFQVNVFNVALQDHNFALAEKMFKRVEKLNKLGNLDMRLEDMRRHLAGAKAERAKHGRVILTSPTVSTSGR
ncbi:MAG: hypothetical protein ACRES9_05170 [Gammaproteobacteria bacterium]